MRKFVLLAVTCGALIVGWGAPSSAQACRTVKCFNKSIGTLRAQVNTLTSRVQAQDATLNCIKLAAVTSYFGYDYNGGTVTTSALDFTESGDAVDAWALALTPGTCGTSSVRSAAADSSARDATPFAPLTINLGGTTRSP